MGALDESSTHSVWGNAMVPPRGELVVRHKNFATKLGITLAIGQTANALRKNKRDQWITFFLFYFGPNECSYRTGWATVLLLWKSVFATQMFGDDRRASMATQNARTNFPRWAYCGWRISDDVVSSSLASP